jgi:hypothetical protein
MPSAFRSGRSSLRRGSWITCPTIPFSPSPKKRTIVDFEQPFRHIDAEIRVSPDPVGIKRRMMDLR